MLEGPRASGLSSFSQGLAFCECQFTCFGDRVCGLFHDEASAAVFDLACGIDEIRGHDGKSCCKRFKENETEVLLTRGKDEEITRLQERDFFDTTNMAHKVHRGVEVQLLH
ncbi:MAG: hypothetical protein DWI11_01110 [Planctomycetota bacterium]|nr:MAG: hypothetical protein DWI11_01110 [Planctomycetota bacterium]